MQASDKKDFLPSGVHAQHRYASIIALCLGISLAFHFFTFAQLKFLANWFEQRRDHQTASYDEPIRFNVVDKSAEQKQVAPRKVLEVEQKETEAPETASYLGQQNHRTEKETRLAESLDRSQAADPGQAGEAASTIGQPPSRPKADERPAETPQTVISEPTPRGLKVPKIQEQSPYAALMPRANELAGQMQAGFQDYVDSSVEVGDRIDINTTEYRFVGYFTHMRKAIQLVWSYPYDAARRGMQGTVRLEFVINRDGSNRHIKVIESSGYKILDDAIVQAIRLASPFAPLPPSFEKDELTVTASFQYILSNLAGAH